MGNDHSLVSLCSDGHVLYNHSAQTPVGALCVCACACARACAVIRGLLLLCSVGTSCSYSREASVRLSIRVFIELHMENQQLK